MRRSSISLLLLYHHIIMTLLWNPAWNHHLPVLICQLIFLALRVTRAALDDVCNHIIIIVCRSLIERRFIFLMGWPERAGQRCETFQVNEPIHWLSALDTGEPAHINTQHIQVRGSQYVIDASSLIPHRHSPILMVWGNQHTSQLQYYTFIL